MTDVNDRDPLGQTSEPFAQDEFIHQLQDYQELGELGEARDLLEWYLDGCWA